MVQLSSTQSDLNQSLMQLLAQTLGQELSASDLKRCFRQLEIQEPSPGKRIWQADNSAAGVYFILSGKARLLSDSGILLSSLGSGDSFGELTLFPEETFRPYTVRASVNLKLCYLSIDRLQSLICEYPDISKHLHRKALLRDLFLICRQTGLFEHVPTGEVMRMLSLLRPSILKVGDLPESFLKKQKFGLIRSGELRDSLDHRLNAGSLYISTQFSEGNSWQVTQPTEFYGLSDSREQMSQEGWTQLNQLIEAAPSPPVAEAPVRTSQPSLEVDSSQPIVQPISQQPAKQKPRHKKRSQAYFPKPTVTVSHWWQRATRRYPFFAQQSASDCGAACLVMVGRYWGKHFSVNRLRQIANVDRNGATLRGLAAAAESIGFSTRPVRASLKQLAKQSLPAIAHWEGRHYVVVYEVNQKQVVVGDPAIGQRTYSHADFKADWTGYALLVEPTAMLREAEETRQAFWQFFELAKPHRLILLEVLAASILIQVFGLVTPLFTQLLLDRVVVQGSTLTLTAVGVGLLIFGLFKVAMTGMRQYLLYHTSNKVNLAMMVGFIRHTLRLPLSFFESRYVGDIVARVQENTKIQRFLTGEALTVFLDLLTVFVYVGLMVWYSWKLALLVLVVVPFWVLLVLIATPFLRRISREIFQALAKQSSYLIEALTGIRTVKSLAIEQTVRWQWEERLNLFIKKTFSGQVIGVQLQLFSSSINAVATASLLWFGGWLVIQGELTIGQLVAFNMLLGNVLSPFQRLAVLWNQLQEVVIAVERINDVLEEEPEEDLLHQCRQSLPPIQGHICFDGVTFRYHPESETNVLENLSFEVQPGQMVALVGRSGSGKSTVAKLIFGLYSPTDGRVLIDGQDISSLSLHPLRQQIGVVDQSTFLFGSTIYENISIGHASATLGDVIEAAKLAGADEFIKQLPMGYETQIGEGGGMLSGGQRQRLAIARALLGNPRLLILDEATSNLDAESERIIQTNLDTILRDRTTLVIAHRLSTVRKADLILVLDRGNLIESGTHQTLMAKRGHYFYLNQQQLSVSD